MRIQTTTQFRICLKKLANVEMVVAQKSLHLTLKLSKYEQNGQAAAPHPTNIRVYGTPLVFRQKGVCHRAYYVWGVTATATFLAAKAEQR